MALSRQTAAYRHRNYQYLCARKTGIGNRKTNNSARRKGHTAREAPEQFGDDPRRADKADLPARLPLHIRTAVVVPYELHRRGNGGRARFGPGGRRGTRQHNHLDFRQLLLCQQLWIQRPDGPQVRLEGLRRREGSVPSGHTQRVPFQPRPRRARPRDKPGPAALARRRGAALEGRFGLLRGLCGVPARTAGGELLRDVAGREREHQDLGARKHSDVPARRGLQLHLHLHARARRRRRRDRYRTRDTLRRGVPALLHTLPQPRARGAGTERRKGLRQPGRHRRRRQPRGAHRRMRRRGLLPGSRRR